VYNELTVDHFNSKLDRIYLTTSEFKNNPEISFLGSYNPFNETSFNDISKHPGVEKHSLFIKYKNTDVSVNEQVYNANVIISDTCFLQILDFSVTAGIKNFIRPEDVFITEAFAKKMFGDKNPIGEKIHYLTIGKYLTVAGIIAKTTHKSTISFDILVSHQLNSKWTNWSWMPQSIILLYPEVNYRDVNGQYNEFFESSFWHSTLRYQLYPYKDLYFSNLSHQYCDQRGKSIYIFILSIVGALLLLTGTVNYINIYTAVILRRSREFGMKKVFGAGRFQIFLQLIFENLILIVLSLIIAFGFSELLSPYIERILEFQQFSSFGFNLALALILILVLPLITSLSPFLRYYYSSPIQSLRAVNIKSKSLFSGRFFLMFQYLITMVMIAVSLFFVRQMNLMLDHDLGYRAENIIKVPFIKMPITTEQWMAREANKEKEEYLVAELKQKLDANPLIERWTFGNSPHQTGNFVREIKTSDGEFKDVTQISTDETWLELFEIELLEGRFWNDTDDGEQTCIVSESLLKEFNIKDYRSTELTGSKTEYMTKAPVYRIIGVVKDFHPTHLSQQQYPILINYFRYWDHWVTRPIAASFLPGRKQEAIQFMKNLHDELIGSEFTYSFVEDEVAAMYEDDRKIALTYSIFTGIAILVSVLGLFSLSLFDIQQRRKEIAIRKVNGALTGEIILMLLRRYFVLLGIAFVISVVIAMFAIHKYLENFALKAPISWWLFVAALAITSVISLLTLIYQAYKAGNENPANVIKG
jgi:hypothetical protein